MEEIYRLSEPALQQGQEHIPVHVFPFRMTRNNLRPTPTARGSAFWRNLKEGYDLFERTRFHLG